LNTNGFDREIGETHGTSAWLFAGLLVSFAGMVTGAALLIWHIAEHIFK
jgi:hypothetical protein